LAVIFNLIVIAMLLAIRVCLSLTLIHGLLYIESLIIGLQSAEQDRLNPPSVDGCSGIPLTSKSSLIYSISRPMSSYT
ncbi:hypothetical protein DER44DRAFT_609265, partial [Fusarium oxysporum]